MDGAGFDSGGHAIVDLDRAQAMGLLASTGYGRIVFSRGVLPAIRPVNHLVADGKIIVCLRVISSSEGAMFVRDRGTDRGTVVAYEADNLDPVHHTGWSVMVTGLARIVTAPDRVDHYLQALHPWIGPAENTVAAIEPRIVTGIRLALNTRCADEPRTRHQPPHNHADNTCGGYRQRSANAHAVRACDKPREPRRGQP